jgi:hypothetical protein
MIELSLKSLLKQQLEHVHTIEDLAAHLEKFLNSGCSVQTEPNGEKTLLETRALVDRIDGLRIYIYPNDHASPHFHVKSADIDATFSITDCTSLQGSPNRKAVDLITYWYGLGARRRLIEIWNKTRPANCPVGPIAESP